MVTGLKENSYVYAGANDSGLLKSRSENINKPKNTCYESLNDAVEISSKLPQKKHSFKDYIANTAKFFVTTSEMVKGTVKGLLYGLAAGGSILGASWLFGALPNGIRKGALQNVFKSPLKSLSTKSKAIAAVAALGISTCHIIAAKLKANQKTANVDHQLKTGHRYI